MKTMIVSFVAAFALSALTLGPPVMAQEPNKSVEPKKDPQAACMDMMHGSGMTAEGKNAMREFMDGSGSMGQGGMMNDRSRGGK